VVVVAVPRTSRKEVSGSTTSPRTAYGKGNTRAWRAIYYFKFPSMIPPPGEQTPDP
jgi:hypothetical protein